MEPAAAASPHVRHCPLCSAVCPGRATICYKCKKPFPARSEPRALREGEVEAAVAQIRAEAPEASAPADLASQPRKFGVATYVMGVLLLASFGLAAVSVEAAIIVAFLMLLLFLIPFMTDLRAPGARGRRDAQTTIRCYLEAVKRGRWKTAHVCLSPQARSRQVRVPIIESLKTRPQDLVMATPKDVRKYWITIARPSGALVRRVANTKLESVVTEGAVQRHRVLMTTQSYSSWLNFGLLFGILPALVLIAAFTRTEIHRFELAAYRWRSQWVLVSGEYASPVDKALPLPLVL